MNMAFGGNVNVVGGLIGAGFGVAVSRFSIWLKQPQYTEHGLLMAVDAGFAYTIWRFCARLEGQWNG
jgi:hypothetical protein